VGLRRGAFAEAVRAEVAGAACAASGSKQPNPTLRCFRICICS
jgi:hypothetical protein